MTFMTRVLMAAVVVGLAAGAIGCGDGRKSEVIVDKTTPPPPKGPAAIKGGMKGPNNLKAPPPPSAP
jgi:hypothetical protein